MSRTAVYKPPRSSPLAGPAISVNVDDDEYGGDDDTGTPESPRNEKSRNSATLSRLPSPYPTPPRTPSPSSDYSKGGDGENATITPGITVGSKSQMKRPRSVGATGIVDASSRVLGSHQDGRSTRRSSHAYVRTPFSAPPTMPDFHPSYDTSAISVRAQRPRTAPGLSSLTAFTSYATPGERGTFSAPGIIRSTAARERHDTLNTQSNSNCKASTSSSVHRHSYQDASSTPNRNWITASNSSPPPFSRTLLTQSVIMPVKATEAAEARRSTRRPKTTPDLRTAALSRFQVQKDKTSQPVPIIISSEEERYEGYQFGPLSSLSHDDKQMSKTVENKVMGPEKGLRDNEADSGGLIIQERRTGGVGRWKLLLRKLGKTNL